MAKSFTIINAKKLQDVAITAKSGSAAYLFL